MKDHKQLVASLSDAQRLDLTRRSDWPGLLHLLCHFLAIVVVAAGIVAEVSFWQLLLVVQGILIVFLFTLLHETVHDTPFASRWLNRLVGRVVGFLIFLPTEWFRYFHLAHHRFTNDPEKDPELAMPKPRTWVQYTAYLSGIPVWIGQLRILVRNALGKCNDDFVPSGVRRRIVAEARVLVVLYCSVGVMTLFLPEVLWVWIVPIFLGQPFLRLYLLAEHGRCPPVANMFENTRTTFTVWLVRKLAWNMPFHAEHHAYPNVPFHKLPEFHAITRHHLKATERGYVRFHARVLRSLLLGESRPL